MRSHLSTGSWLAILVFVSACDCGGGETTDGGVGADGATMDGALRDGAACTPERSCLSGRLCCEDGEECVDDRYCLPICDNTRCGDNGSICCDAGEICLDGVVCAASCAADETVCGASLDTCCAAGQACVNDACVTPGDACVDDYDCLTEGDYCELTIGHCLAIPDVDPACEILPDFDDIELEVEWHWSGVMAGGQMYQHVAATPAVGDVSGDGIPDVVVPAYRTGDDAILVALSGADGTLLWSIGPGADDPDWISPPAVGNLDPSDDALEIVYALQGGGIRVVDGDGTTQLGRRTTGGAGATRSAPSIADMDGDGTPDVIVGCHAMNGLDISTAAMDFFDHGTCLAPTQSFTTTVVADLDGDGLPEVTSGGAAYQIGATAADETLWTRAGTPHGLPAVADLDGDGAPEVIVVRSGTAIVIDGATGAMRIGPGGSWVDTTLSIPGGGQGGAPTVADFDADGQPEFATAGQGQYIVYDPDCTATPPRSGGACASGATNLILWQAPTQDISSSVTGSSVFDFQGDGVAEVVYNDECFLHVYDGRDGREVLMTPRPSSSRTALEYPLVVDVDRDGNSEIVVPSNSDQNRARPLHRGMADRARDDDAPGRVRERHERHLRLRRPRGPLGTNAPDMERVRVPRDQRGRPRGDPHDRARQLDRPGAEQLPAERPGRGRVQRAEPDRDPRSDRAMRGGRDPTLGGRAQLRQPRRARRRRDRAGADGARARGRRRHRDDVAPAPPGRDRARHGARERHPVRHRPHVRGARRRRHRRDAGPRVQRGRQHSDRLGDVPGLRVSDDARTRPPSAERRILMAAGLFGATAVLAGAFGAHALRERLAPDLLSAWDTAARYHLVHAVAMLGSAWASARFGGRAAAVSAIAFGAGITLFSGSLYTLALTGTTWLGAVTPLGGLAFVAGWIALGWAGWRGR